MRSRRAIVLIVLVVSSALAAARAVDRDHGDITGIIADVAGTRLPGVVVTLTGFGRLITTTTDARGAFSFVNLLPGSYEVRTALHGHSPAVKAVTVQAGRVQALELRLVGAPLESEQAIPAPDAAGVAKSEAAPQPGVAGGILGGIVGSVPQAVRAADGFYGRSAMVLTYTPPGRPDAYAHTAENGFRRVLAEPLSTFSIDVDTASYANVRRFLADGSLPPPEAVRVEEMINYFRYDYPRPTGGRPFSITTELVACPWNPRHKLALVGIQTAPVEHSETARNLVFLLDVSGSMDSPDKLPLVRNAMRMLTEALTPRDRVAIVVYAGASGVALPSTTGDRKAVIHEAIAQLRAGGSTNGAAGITLAYQIARRHFIAGGVNRVILATDGDFNVGVSNEGALTRLIERERASGVFLSVLGVGTGNLQDATMELLADKGNGNYSYLDTLHEARKVLVREAGGTLVTVAKDVKIQIEFNPAHVGGYRLIGYENRMLQNEDFNDDRKDAGEIGAGHSVTALYEIVPPGAEASLPSVDPLKYQSNPTPPRAQTPAAGGNELMTVKVRYKAPDGAESRLVSTTLGKETRAISANIGFASAVAEVGMLLRKSEFLGSASYQSAIARARTFNQNDPDGYRAEFVRLADLAGSLAGLRNSSR